MTAKTSRYLEAGAPTSCFLPACPNEFRDACHHARDGHYYCSEECASAAGKIDLSRVEKLDRRVAR